jgi:hypothetical protein
MVDLFRTIAIAPDYDAIDARGKESTKRFRIIMPDH